MAEPIFREKSLKRITSPEELGDYLRVTSPTVWMVLAAVILLLAGMLFWSATTSIDSFVTGTAQVESGSMRILFDDEETAKIVTSGMTVKVGETFVDDAFIVDHVESRYDPQDPGERSQMLHEDCVEAAKIEDEIERESDMKYLAQRYGISEKIISRYVAKELLRDTAQQQNEIRAREDRQQKREALKADPGDTEQKIMLTMLTSRPEIIPRITKYLTPQDFTNPMYRKVAEMVFDQAGKTGRVSEAGIIDYFGTAEEQSEAASLFNTHLALDSDEERIRAFTDVLIRLKRKSLKARSDALDPSDMKGFMQVMDERKQIDRLAASGLPDEIFRS